MVPRVFDSFLGSAFLGTQAQTACAYNNDCNLGSKSALVRKPNGRGDFKTRCLGATDREIRALLGSTLVLRPSAPLP
jgi:hypothetical protein